MYLDVKLNQLITYINTMNGDLNAAAVVTVKNQEAVKRSNPPATERGGALQ